MRKSIMVIGMGLLLASPAFAAKPHHRTHAAATTNKAAPGAVAQSPEAKPAEAKPADKPAKHKAKSSKKGEKSAEKPADKPAEPAAAPAK